MNILIVEDVNMYVKILKKTFSNLLKYKIYETGTISEGKEILASEDIELVLLDANLPDGNGKDIIRFIRNDLKNEVIYIIAITSETTESNILEMYELGIDYYIPKPFSPNLIKATAERINRRLEVFYDKKQ